MIQMTKISGNMAQLFTRHCPSLCITSPSFLHTAAVLEAARKGTRAKAEAKKRAKKKVEVKKEFIPLKKRLELKMSGGKSPRRVDDHLGDATDNVWFMKYYRWKAYSVSEALKMHRETHHETQLDCPDSLVNAYIELQMDYDKKNRFMDNFSNVLQLPHAFDTERPRNILVISKKEEVHDYAEKAGVARVIGTEIVKLVQNDEIDMTHFHYICTELDLLPEIVALRGLMKKKFPNPKNGTAVFDLIPTIDRFMQGVDYKTDKDKFFEDFATIEVPFGRLNMSDEHLEDNLSVLLKDIERRRDHQRKSTELISKVVIRSRPSSEQFKINHFELIRDHDTQEVEAVAQ